MYIQNFGFTILQFELVPRVLILFALVVFTLLHILDRKSGFVSSLWYSISESREAGRVIFVKIIVTLYSTMLFCMMLSGIDAAMVTEGNKFDALTGALLFVISDMLIATKALSVLPFHDAIIMLTYYAAQHNIAKWSMRNRQS